MRATIDLDNAITLAIIMAVCFALSRDRSSNVLVLLALILVGALIFCKGSESAISLDEKGYYAISGQLTGIGSYGSRN